MDVWVTIGFTYRWRKYCLLKEGDGRRLCLVCTYPLLSMINAFCYRCKAPRPLDWTTGNKSLDLFIMESWSNMKYIFDAYIQWIEYSLLTNIQETTSLRHGCTHIADWRTNELTRVTLKKTVDKGDDQSFDFRQVNYFTCTQIVLLTCVSKSTSVVTTVFVYSNS